MAKTMQGSGGQKLQEKLTNLMDNVAGLPGVELHLPTGVDLPEGLHRQPAEPVLRDHELACCTTSTR